MEDALQQWIASQDLAPAYERVFEDDFPKSLPSSYMRIVGDAITAVEPTAAYGQLQPSGLDTYHAVQLAVAAQHVPLTRAVDEPYRGHPRLRFSEQQLARGFEMFLLAPSAASSLTTPGDKYKEAAGLSALAPATMEVEAAPLATVPAASTAGEVVPVVQAAMLDGDDAIVASMTLHPRQLEEMNDAILRPAWQRLRDLKWADWPFENGNPFVVKLTKANVAKLGVPGYFAVVTKPMDLTRMNEKLKDKLSDKHLMEGKEAKCYKSVSEFVADVKQIALNAKMFNAPHSLAASKPTEYPPPSSFPPGTFPAGSVYPMAFDLEQVWDHLQPVIMEQWAAAEKRNKRIVLEETRKYMASHSSRPV